ncbi:MAG: hypothetical protein JKY67_19390 [Pseudomonadales bacterium]|nr:hypothetical protein [Pseudomonadales bacterium]
MKLLSIVLFSAAIATPALANETYNTEVVKNTGHKWMIRQVLASSTQKGTRISGRTTAIRRFGLPRGHIDVAAYTPSGELIAEATTDYTPAILTRKKKQKGGVRFAVNLTETLPSNAVVKVAFHPSEKTNSVNPSHQSTIAR